jgi:hypothetical protein
MTLKEKFRDLDSMNWRNNDNEKIADEFAIGFAEWLFDVSRKGSTKELLEIYKKENNL